MHLKCNNAQNLDPRILHIIFRLKLFSFHFKKTRYMEQYFVIYLTTTIVVLPSLAYSIKLIGVSIYSAMNEKQHK